MNWSIPSRILATTMLSCALAAQAVYAESDSDKANHANSVRVTNTNANPVPVNGNVVVSGTANVNVTNPVTIANPVSTVTVGNTTPIPVTVTGTAPAPIVENPARSAFHDEVTIFMADGVEGLAKNLQKPIPAGTRLVVELISVGCTSNGGAFPTTVTLSVYNRSQTFAIPLTYQGNDEFGKAFHTGILHGGIYFDSGDVLNAFVTKSSLAGLTECNVMLSGHLVTL